MTIERMFPKRNLMEEFIRFEYGTWYLWITKFQSFFSKNYTESLFYHAFWGCEYDDISDAGCRFANYIDSKRDFPINDIKSVNTLLPYELVWSWCRKHRIHLSKARRMETIDDGYVTKVTGRLLEVNCSGLSFIG